MEYFTWSVDPVLFSIGAVKIRWYSLLFALGFIFGFSVMKSFYLREGKNIQDLDRLLIYLVVGTVIGARLGHVFLYDPGYYLSNPLKIFAVWEGGLASHGGGIGVLLSLYLYTRKTGDSFLWLVDRVAIPTALAGCCIRLGNFFNSEILGTQTDVPWAIIFENVDKLPRHPVQLYESISYAAIFAVLFALYRQNNGKTRNGEIFGVFLVLVFIARFAFEFVKTKQEAYVMDIGISTGQLLSVPFMIAGLILVLRARKLVTVTKKK